MRKGEATLLAAGAVIGANWIGSRYNPGPGHPRTAFWYRSLRKPWFTPPGPAIGAAWTALDVLLAVTGYRLLRAEDEPTRTAALALWGVTLAGLAGWPWLFFGRKDVRASVAAAAGMAAAGAGLVATTARVDRPAALASVPLVAWLGFATLLSEELYRRN